MEKKSETKILEKLKWLKMCQEVHDNLYDRGLDLGWLVGEADHEPHLAWYCRCDITITKNLLSEKDVKSLASKYVPISDSYSRDFRNFP